MLRPVQDIPLYMDITKIVRAFCATRSTEIPNVRGMLRRYRKRFEVSVRLSANTDGELTEAVPLHALNGLRAIPSAPLFHWNVSSGQAGFETPQRPC
jgi:hypothetical protein